MKFNYGLEKKRFDENWEKIRKEYREAGMDEESIEKMYEYDWEIFKKERIWCLHNQYMNGKYMCVNNRIWETEDEDNPLIYYFVEKFSYQFSEEDFMSKNAWIESLEDKKLFNAISDLNNDQKMILKLRILDDMSLEEIASIYGVSAVAIHKRINRILEKIKKIYQQG